jgi:hypothetical protein
MDFITDLPLSLEKDSILVVVDRFSKMAHFLACRKELKGEEVAEIYLSNIAKLHGFPEDIVSDRGPQFMSKFWRHFHDLLGTKTNLSSAYHPQTDGQTERVNQILEQYLRCFINFHQDNWTKYLPLAELAHNNTLHSSTGQTPFFSNYGYHPKFDFLPKGSETPLNPTAEDLVTTLRQVHEQLIEELTRAQHSYKEYADKQRKEQPTFNIGDKVWLLRRNVRTTRPSDKLDYKRLGPFTITAQIGPVAFRLQLPASMKIHNVFHTSLLEPYYHSTIPGRKEKAAPPVYIEDQEEWEISSILDSKLIHGKLHYLVDWKGYGPEERTWEPEENITHAPEALKEFLQHHPGTTRGPSGRVTLRRG